MENKANKPDTYLLKNQESGSSRTNPDGLLNSDRRTCLKIVSGAAIGAGAFSVFPAAAQPLVAKASAPLLESGAIDDTPVLPDLTININLNRPDLPDWMLIENMREEPLVLTQFAPRWLVYNEKLLDLNAMLSRQQRGRNQLEIWPNYAWNHSVRGAVRSVHECGTLPQNCFDAGKLSSAVIQSGHQSLQLPAQVSRGVVTLLES